jgi:group I intron endonuclease
MESGIYKIVNIINGDIYVGSSVNLEKRKREHFTSLTKNKNHPKLLQRAYNKYGKESNKIYQDIS